MSDFSIPHLPPVRFVDSVLYADENRTEVKISFDILPSLAMLVEAATQSSSGIKDDEGGEKMGFLVSLKDVKLLKEISSKEYTVLVELIHKIDNFKSLLFAIMDKKQKIAEGNFSITVQ